MEIRRSLDRDGTLGPQALDYLAEIPEKYLFSSQQQLRHPAAIYNVSLEKVTKAFVEVVEGYANETDHFKIASNGKFEIKSLLESQEHLLRCLQEHMDDSYLILKTFIDPATTKSKQIFARIKAPRCKSVSGSHCRL